MPPGSARCCAIAVLKSRPPVGRWDRIVAVAAAALALSGCTNPIFGCTEQPQCGDEGTCQPTGFCSFPDDDCESGQRYGELAAAGFAGNCVPPDQATGVADGSSGDGPGPMTDPGETLSDADADTGSGPNPTMSVGDSGEPTGEPPTGPDPYGRCMGNVCDYATSVCVSNGPYSMCSPPCTVVDESSDECPRSPFTGVRGACLYTSQEHDDQSCFLTCEVDTECPGDSVCAGSVCSYLEG